MNAYPSELEERWQASDEFLLVRPIKPSDAPALDAFFHRMTPEDIRGRFFATVRELSPQMLRKFTRLDYERDMAFIAVRETTGETLGVARLARTDADASVAEFAVAVAHDFQHRGLATHLVQRLLDWAPRHGVREITGEILADNKRMLDFARHLGFFLAHRNDADIVEARLSLVPPVTRLYAP